MSTDPVIKGKVFTDEAGNTRLKVLDDKAIGKLGGRSFAPVICVDNLSFAKPLLLIQNLFIRFVNTLFFKKWERIEVQNVDENGNPVACKEFGLVNRQVVWIDLNSIERNMQGKLSETTAYKLNTDFLSWMNPDQLQEFLSRYIEDIHYAIKALDKQIAKEKRDSRAESIALSEASIEKVPPDPPPELIINPVYKSSPPARVGEFKGLELPLKTSVSISDHLSSGVFSKEELRCLHEAAGYLGGLDPEIAVAIADDRVVYDISSAQYLLTTMLRLPPNTPALNMKGALEEGKKHLRGQLRFNPAKKEVIETSIRLLDTVYHYYQPWVKQNEEYKREARARMYQEAVNSLNGSSVSSADIEYVLKRNLTLDTRLISIMKKLCNIEGDASTKFIIDSFLELFKTLENDDLDNTKSEELKFAFFIYKRIYNRIVN